MFRVRFPALDMRIYLEMESFTFPQNLGFRLKSAINCSFSQCISCYCLLFNDGHVVYYSYGQGLSPSIEGWYMIWVIYDGYIRTGSEYGPNFLTFVLRLRENPGKTSIRKLTQIGDRTRTRCVTGNDFVPRPQRWSAWVVTEVSPGILPRNSAGCVY